MKSQNYTTAFTVDQTPKEAYDAINNVRGWWSGNIEGSTDKLGDEWTYRYEDIHYSKQRITELVPGKKVVWLVLDSSLNFIEDKTEWNGTKYHLRNLQEGRQDRSPFHPRGPGSRLRMLWRLLKRMGLLHQRQLAEIDHQGQGTAQQERKGQGRQEQKEARGTFPRKTACAPE